MTCLAQSTSVFTNCAILNAVAAAISGNVFNTIFALSIASYLSMYPILLAPPLALLLFDQVQSKSKSDVSAGSFYLRFTLRLAGTLQVLLYLSFRIMGSSWRFLSSSYGVQLTLADLTPNVGLWWYFFTEMFDSFREFFLAVFWLHMSSYVVGLSIRIRCVCLPVVVVMPTNSAIRKQPLLVVTSLLGILAIFKPYPSIADASLFFAMLPLYKHIFPRMSLRPLTTSILTNISGFRYGFIEMAALLYASFLGPAFYHLWIYAGSGNANFFYAITLVWSLGLTLVVTDLVYAALVDEFEVERPDVKGKDVRQI